MSEQKTVRLTDEAHALLAEKAVDYEESMKDVASEAIFSLDKRETKDKECRRHIEALKAGIQRVREERAFYILLVGVAGGILGFIIGTVIG